MTAPNNRPTVSGSCRVHSKLIRQTNSGAVEFRIAVSALSTDCWPKAMSVYGIAQATQPWMNRQPTKFHCAGTLRCVNNTMIHSTIAANATRDPTKVIGGMVVSAIFVRA